MGTKICGKCKQEIPISEFYKSKRDGFRSRCKPCNREDTQEYIKTGYYREYYKRPEIIERRKPYMREYMRGYTKQPDVAVKVFARHYLNNAITAGTINREPCTMCGKEQAHGHHEDYSKPLLVVWLCSGCHWKLHAQRKVYKEVITWLN